MQIRPCESKVKKIFCSRVQNLCIRKIGIYENHVLVTLDLGVTHELSALLSCSNKQPLSKNQNHVLFYMVIKHMFDCIYLKYFSCSQDSDILGGDFDSVETSIPLINRYYVNLYVFKFYNSDDVFFKCTVKLCPSGSSDCDIVSRPRVRRGKSPRWGKTPTPFIS